MGEKIYCLLLKKEIGYADCSADLDKDECKNCPARKEKIRRRLAGRESEYFMFADDDEVNIVIFPDAEKLQKEVEKLRTQLSMLLLERDELRYVVCRDIEARYMLELGGTEYKAYEAQCAALRLKRKAELIRAKRNRREKIIISAIENTLDTEFAEYTQKLGEQMKKMNDALEYSGGEFLSEKDTAELKKLYRKIVKEFHPDLDPKSDPERVRLFENAVAAYKNGDLAAMRMIAEMAGNTALPREHRDILTELTEEKERLGKMLKDVRESIEKIKSEYPYTMKEILEDPEKIQLEKEKLEEILENYIEMAEYYKAEIEKMLR